MSSLPVRAYEILREQGPAMLWSRTVNFIGKRAYRRKHKLVYQIRKVSTSPTPQLIIHVDPSDIQHILLKSDKTDRSPEDGYEFDRGQFVRRENAGKIIGGDWDQHTTEFANLPHYIAFKQFFLHDKEWEDTEYYNMCIQQIKNGEAVYGCQTEEDFKAERLRYVEKIYEDMINEGYKAQKELPKSNRRLGAGFEGKLHEVNISIGRNGKLIFNNTGGHNRLALAKIADIDRIVCAVIVRHREWQCIRKRIVKAQSKEYINRNLKRYIEHPDITYLS